MQFIDLNIIYQIFAYSSITAFLLSYILYRRLTTGVRTKIRVHFSGGTEKHFNAVEVDKEVVWSHEGEEMRAIIPIDVVPTHGNSWGVHYRIFDITDGGDEVMKVPWMNVDVHAQYLQGEAAAKERYRRRLRAADSFKKIAAGLRSMSLRDTLIAIFLGFFAGLWAAPIIAGFLAGG